RGRGRARPALRLRRVRRGPRPPGAPARHQSGRGARRGPPGGAARGERLDPRPRRRGGPLVAPQRGTRTVGRALLAGDLRPPRLQLYLPAARANGRSPDAGRRLLAWAHPAGFTEVTPSASTTLHATPEQRSTWGAAWAKRILAAPLADQLRAEGWADAAELE